MEVKTEWYEIVSKGTKAEIIMHGYIGPYDEINSKKFTADFKALEAKHTEIEINLNSGGGSIFEGLPIYNTISSSKATVDIVVTGMAASMGSIALLSATGKRKAFKNARIMVHKASGGSYGSATKLRETADMLESLESTMADIYVEKTGQPIEVVNTWMQEGKDKWFTAKQALEAGLIDEIIDEAPVKAPKNSLAPEAMHQYFSNQFQAIHQKPKMKKLLFITALAAFNSTFAAKLTEESSEDEILNGFKATLTEKDQEITNLKKKLEDNQKASVESLISGAIADKKILASQKEQYTKLANADFESTSAILAGMAPASSLTSAADRGNAGGAEGEAGKDPRASWDFNKWRKEDPKGLEAMMDKDPKQYNALKDAYGKR